MDGLGIKVSEMLKITFSVYGRGHCEQMLCSIASVASYFYLLCWIFLDHLHTFKNSTKFFYMLLTVHIIVLSRL